MEWTWAELGWRVVPAAALTTAAAAAVAEPVRMKLGCFPRTRPPSWGTARRRLGLSHHYHRRPCISCDNPDRRWQKSSGRIGDTHTLH